MTIRIVTLLASWEKFCANDSLMESNDKIVVKNCQVFVTREWIKFRYFLIETFKYIKKSFAKVSKKILEGFCDRFLPLTNNWLQIDYISRVCKSLRHSSRDNQISIRRFVKSCFSERVVQTNLTETITRLPLLMYIPPNPKRFPQIQQNIYAHEYNDSPMSSAYKPTSLMFNTPICIHAISCTPHRNMTLTSIFQRHIE